MTAVLLLLALAMTGFGTWGVRRRGQLRAWEQELDVAFAVHHRPADLRRGHL